MTKQKKFITCDGNQAAAHISYMFSACGCDLSHHPIFDSCAEYVPRRTGCRQDAKKIFGETVLVEEMQIWKLVLQVAVLRFITGRCTGYYLYRLLQGLLLMIPVTA